jgi:DHA3 family macrolide efflux protein-like MFS transporter
MTNQVEGTAINDTAPPGATQQNAQRLGAFMTIWSGQAISLFGSQATQFALIWWLTLKTGSPAILASATFVGLLPQVVLGPFIGTLVDRWSRRTIMLLSDATVAAASLALAFMFQQGTPSVPAVFAVLFVRALGSAFHAPAMLAASSLMVPPQHLTRVQGLDQALEGALSIAGAPAGALLYAALSMAGVMMVDVVTALFAIVSLLFITIPKPASIAGVQSQRAGGLFTQTLAGLRYLRSCKGHMALVMIAASINLFLAPAFSLLPLLVQNELGGSAMTLGWMTSLFGAGMIAGGIALGAWGGFRRRIATSLAGILGLGAAVLTLGMAPSQPLIVTATSLLMVGAMVPFCNGPIVAIMQATIDPVYQGRVFSLLGSLAAATAPLGLLLAAPIASIAGVRAWLLAGGAIALAMGAIGFMTPALIRIEQTNPAPSEVPAPISQEMSAT